MELGAPGLAWRLGGYLGALKRAGLGPLKASLDQVLYKQDRL